MVTDNVMFKIKSLLNMTVQHGCTQEEANTAMEKAQSLMLQHNLDIRDIQTGESKTEESDKIGMVDKPTDFHMWKAILLNVIAKNMMCYVVRSPQKRMCHLFGTRTNVEIVNQMHDWICLQLDQMSIRDFQIYRSQGGTNHGLAWKTSYFNTAVNVIGKRLEKPFTEFANGTGTSIVIYNDKMVGEAVKRVFPHVTQSHHRYHVNDGSSYGHKAGENVSLKPQTKLNNNSKMYLS